MHFDDCFANQSGSEKCPERHQKVTTSDAGKVEQWVWNL